MATSARTESATKTRTISRDFTARWSVPPIALMLLLSNLMLIHRPVYAALWAGQVLFCLLALTGFLNRAGKRSKVAFLPFCFVLMNLSAALALGRLLLGRRGGGVWEPVER
jgi:hypothetical protein